MARLAQCDQIAPVICTAFTQRNLMVDLLCLHEYSGYSPICMTLNVTSALPQFLYDSEPLSRDDCRMMILLEVFLMLSVVRYSLLLRKVSASGSFIARLPSSALLYP